MKTRNRILTALTVCALGSAVLAATSTASRANADGPVPFAVAGDSLSANTGSWLHQLNDPALTYVGGYQHAGDTTTNDLTSITAVPGAQVLVVMLGTNDIKDAASAAQISTNIEAIVQKVGAPHVLISALPPSNITKDTTTHVNRRTQGIVENRALVALAAQHGWLYADPYSFQRAWTNAWGAGASTDGTHPTTAVSTLVAQRMDVYIRQADLAATGAGS
jgi:lysophospholipase L1-like esterase